MKRNLKTIILASLLVSSIGQTSYAAIPLAWYQIDTTETVEEMKSVKDVPEDGSKNKSNTNDKKIEKNNDTKNTKLTMAEKIKLILSENFAENNVSKDNYSSAEATMNQEHEIVIDNSNSDQKIQEKSVTDDIIQDDNELLRVIENQRKEIEYQKSLIGEMKKYKDAIVVPIDKLPINELNVNDVNKLDSVVNRDEVVFQFQEGMTYQGYCRNGWNTDIQIPVSEFLQNIQIGDRSRWKIETTQSDDAIHVYIQPMQKGLETNLILTTNQRVYQLYLKSTEQFNPIIKFTYAQNTLEYTEDELPVMVNSVNSLNFNYSVVGKVNWKPSFIFDDGYRTYIHMPEESISKYPALFIKTLNGEMIPVNYSVKSNNYVLPKIIDAAQLRIGNQVVQIKKNT